MSYLTLPLRKLAKTIGHALPKVDIDTEAVQPFFKKFSSRTTVFNNRPPFS